MLIFQQVVKNPLKNCWQGNFSKSPGKRSGFPRKRESRNDFSGSAGTFWEVIWSLKTVRAYQVFIFSSRLKAAPTETSCFQRTALPNDDFRHSFPPLPAPPAKSLLLPTSCGQRSKGARCGPCVFIYAVLSVGLTPFTMIAPWLAEVQRTAQVKIVRDIRVNMRYANSLLT